MDITLSVPEELASRLQPVERHLPQILELGIRAWSERDAASFAGYADVFEKLAALPSPEEVLALRPTPALEERLDELMEKSQSVGLTSDEEREWRQYEYVDHLVQMAKARAALKLQGR